MIGRTKWGREIIVLVILLFTVGAGAAAWTAVLPDTESDMARAFAEMMAQGVFPQYDTLQLDSLIGAKMAQYHIPGVAVCIFDDSSIIMTRNYGWADIENAIPVADTTVFLLASISKTFVANAAMQMWENGYLDLDADVNEYIPFDVSNPYYPDSSITMRQIMSHTSSIDRRDWTWTDDYVWGSDSPIPLGDYLEQYLSPGGSNYSPYNYLSSPPGWEFEYSNYAFSLAGYIVEQIAISNGIAGSLEQYCQDSIWEPLGMDETSWFLSNLDTNNIAVHYGYSGEYDRLGFFGFPLYPAGQVRSSASHLARHAMAFMNYGRQDAVRILDSTTVELMRVDHYPVVPTDPEPGLEYIYGLGWCKWFDQTAGWEYWGHTGGIDGCRTITVFEPDQRKGFVLLMNMRIADELLELVFPLLGFIEDSDMDGIIAGLDNCPETYNPMQLDGDSDLIGDLCDDCTDSDFDGFGDPGYATNSCADDNCPAVFNPGQEDLNGNDIGDACEGCCGFWTKGYTGNANCSEDGLVTLSDITRLIDYVFVSKEPLCCEGNGNTNGSEDLKITLADISRLIDRVFISKNATEPCL